MESIISVMPNRRNFLKGKYTLKIGYPWLTYGAIIELEEILKPTFKVLEFGSGGSTVFFSRRCETVKTVDTNPLWTERVKSVLPNPSNVELICASFDNTLEIAKSEPEEYYDLILVDSDPDPSYRNRLLLMQVCTSKIKMGGYLVIDNYDHRALKKFDYSPFRVYTYDGIRHSGRGTRICVRRMVAVA